MNKVNFEPSHPITWYLPFLYLYNLSVLILDVINIRNALFYKETLISTWLAIVTSSVLLILLTNKSSLSSSIKSISKDRKQKTINNKLLMQSLLLFSIGLCAFYNIHNLSLGLMKAETGQIWYFTFFNYYSIILTILFCVYSLQKFEERSNFILRSFFFLFSINLFTSLNTGERDLFFSFLMSTLLLLYVLGFFSKKAIFSLGFIGLLMVPVMGAMKSIFIRTEVNLGEENIFISILSGEFISAGKNLETLFLKQENWDYFYGLTYFWDIRRILTPGFSGGNYTSLDWFADTFYWQDKQANYGHGFTLIGEGYINFGYVGVCITMGIATSLLIFIYNKAHKSFWGCVYYLMSIPFFVYAIRADLANIASPLLKRILLIIIVIKIVDILLENLKSKLPAHAS